MFRKALALFFSFCLVIPSVACSEPEAPPTVDISAIRAIHCWGAEGEWEGSGFLIADHILVTALHVANADKCVDSDTNTPVVMYKSDPKHDLALMTGPGLPTNIPYIKISCSRFATGQEYISWGRTSYGMDSWDNVITRMNTITTTADYTPADSTLDDGTPDPGLRIFDGEIAPGMSGGPVTSLTGYAYGLNNAGSDEDTLIYEFADGMLCGK